MNNLILRALTGIVFVAVLVGGTLFSPITFTVLFAAITGLTVWEFSTNVNNHAGASVNRLINTVAAVYLFVAFGGFCADYVPSKAFIPYLISVVYLLVSELYLQKPDPLKNWAYAFASQIYVALAFSLLNVLHTLLHKLYIFRIVKPRIARRRRRFYFRIIEQNTFDILFKRHSTFFG